MAGSGYESESDVIATSMKDFSYVDNGVFVRFNQWEFIDLDAFDYVTTYEDTNMDEFGWMYYPKQCAEGGCKAGMIIHGCLGRALELTQFWVGWESIANNNDIILIFP